MSLKLEQYLNRNSNLLKECTPENGAKKFTITLPPLSKGREISCAWLILPQGFPNLATAGIKLSSECVLKIPHVEIDGSLCMIHGDPGPTSGASETDRLTQLLDAFFNDFLDPWNKGELDNHFISEAMNYWNIHCVKNLSSHNAITKVLTVDKDRSRNKIYSASLLVKKKKVVAGTDANLTQRFISSLNEDNQITRVLVAEVPISFPFTPDLWPKNEEELLKLLKFRLNEKEEQIFFTSRKKRQTKIYRIVIFRAPVADFGFLLSGGPPHIIKKGFSTKSYPNHRMIPISVERIDASWTTGRDQHPEVSDRQKKNVLVIGAGALGSPVTEQLAKAGVGRITIVDHDTLDPANIGRHSLGADSLNKNKANALAMSIRKRWPSCEVMGFPNSFDKWIERNSLSNIDMILDLTGEPDVRAHIENERLISPTDLIIGWMEPYVAAAHACTLPSGSNWLIEEVDQLEKLQSVAWPKDIWINEPSCSSVFQSYTSSAAVYAVGLVTEATLDLIDKKISKPVIRHWVRGQSYLDKHYPGLKHRDWCIKASAFDGINIEEDYGS